MPRYNYAARAAGSIAATTGTLDAFSRREALHLLQARGLQVVRLVEEGGALRPISGSNGNGASAAARRLSTKERLPFLEALVDLVNAGLSAGEAVRLLAMRLQEPKLKSLCASLWARLGEGSTLSTAMGEHPAVFDRQTVNLIAAGEATGNLKEVLSRLIQHFTEQRDLRQKFLATLAYPAFICFLGGGVVLFLLFFLVPRLQTLLGSLGGRLPFATRLLVNGSHFLLYAGPFIALSLAVGLGFFLRWRQTPDGRRQSDAWLLRLPVVRDFVVQAAILNFAHTLAVLIENGVTTAEALRLTERAVDNTRVQEILHEATDRVIEGASLCASLQRTNLIPPLFLDRLAVGEQTGHLAPSLRQIAQSYQVGLSRRLQNATRLISGTVLFATFGFVAFLAYAIVTALFQVSASFRL
ncbi:MAG: type II secretion system F family protein [Opitutae bacterium]|nr:type II secretion system F family protein [Opitutae bacterium]